MTAFNEFDIPIVIFIALSILIIGVLAALCLIACRVTRREWSPDKKLRHLMEETSVEMRGRAREEGRGGVERPPEQGAYVIKLSEGGASAGPHANRDSVPPPG